jgi:hypothetical protein
MIINGLVAILLVLTIGYCMLLNRRLKLLKADEHSLRATISELLTATDIAERAIAGLKLTVEECDVELAARLTRGDRLTAELDRRIAAGKSVLERLTRAAAAGDNASKEQPPAPVAQRRSETKPPAQDVQAVAAAAQAFAEKLRVKVHGLAA